MVWMCIGALFLGAILAIIVAFIFTYNNLISLRNIMDNSWAQIDVQLKKRYDLIPNLVETVKGYVKHESSVFIEVTNARASMANASTMIEKAKATDILTSALKSLFAVAENYPQLQANQNFLSLQQELSNIESIIASMRHQYNNAVVNYNTSIQTIPSNIVADLCGFKSRDYFKVENVIEREAPKVKF